MRSRRRSALWLIGLGVLALTRVGRTHASAMDAGTAEAVPVLVELFTAEGCASCPPADVLLEKMLEAQPAAGAVIIGLGEHVDYWNQQGWKDRFSSASFTKRQQLYASHVGSDEVYTPQMVVDGEARFVGSDIAEARRAIEHAKTQPHGSVRVEVEPSTRDGDKVAISVEMSGLPAISRDDPADLVVAVTEDGLRTEVKRGENQGRTLTHAAVVREMKTVAEVVAAAQSARTTIDVPSDAERKNLKLVAFVQQRRSRRVLATTVAPFPADARQAARQADVNAQESPVQ
jgi:hypothetical protein